MYLSGDVNFLVFGVYIGLRSRSSSRLLVVKEKDRGVWERRREMQCALEVAVGLIKCATGDSELGFSFGVGFVV